DRTHQALGLEPLQVDGEKPVCEFGGPYLDSIREHERAAELAGGNAAGKKFSRLVLLLPAPHPEFAVLPGDLAPVARKATNRERYAQALPRAVGSLDALDVIGGVTIAALSRTVD